MGTLFRGREYLQLGVDSRRQPIWKQGIVSPMKKGFCVATSHGQLGDSGSGIFDSSSLFLGISVENMPVGEIADHHPDSKIIGSEIIFAIVRAKQEKYACRLKVSTDYL